MTKKKGARADGPRKIKDRPLVKAEIVKRRPPGRPPWIPSQEDIENITKWRAVGLNHQQIADLLGISHETLFLRKAEYPEFAAAFTVGKAKGIAAVAAKVFANATTFNNFAAQQYYLTVHGKWRAPQSVELTGKDQGPVETKSTSDKEVLDKVTNAIDAIAERLVPPTKEEGK